jgi:hypothetical protein
MAKKEKSEQQVEGVPPSILKKLSEKWMSAAQTKSTPELEQEIISSVRSISQQTKDMKEDSKIIDLQNDLKTLKGGYTDLIAEDKSKIEYIIYLLNSRGIVVNKPKISTNIKKAEETE